MYGETLSYTICTEIAADLTPAASNNPNETSPVCTGGGIAKPKNYRASTSIELSYSIQSSRQHLAGLPFQESSAEVWNPTYPTLKSFYLPSEKTGIENVCPEPLSVAACSWGLSQKLKTPEGAPRHQAVHSTLHGVHIQVAFARVASVFERSRGST